MVRFATFTALLCCSLISFAEDICKTGLSQSPINIDLAHEAELPDINFLYNFSDMRLYNLLPVNFFITPKDEMMLDVDTTRYPLVNIHLHTPSEHTLGGNRFPMEIHFVHENFEKKQVIVAQFTKIGKHNAALETILKKDALGRNLKGDTKLEFGLDPRNLLAPFHHYYKYEGSETFPPCQENVTWYVLKEPIEIGRSQILALRELVGENSRPVQAMNGRQVYTQMPK